MPFVAERWLGGTLTNFRTIRSRLTRLEEVERSRRAKNCNAYSKKTQSALGREYRKMFRNLNGLRTMNRMPECMVIIDPKKEKNAVKEARSMGITTVALIDTDCDPDQIDLPIPGNDDGLRSVEVIMRHLADAVLSGAARAARGGKTRTRSERRRPSWSPPRRKKGMRSNRCSSLPRNRSARNHEPAIRTLAISPCAGIHRTVRSRSRSFIYIESA